MIDTVAAIEIDMFYKFRDIVTNNVADDPIIPELLDELYKEWKDRRNRLSLRLFSEEIKK